MIVVDTSIWIDWFGPDPGLQASRLGREFQPHEVILCDIVLLEILQGARSEAHSRRLEIELRTFQLVSVLDPSLAVMAARNFRTLRSVGTTMKKTADLIIGTYCIHQSHALLTKDNDFQPMAQHLGLQLA